MFRWLRSFFRKSPTTVQADDATPTPMFAEIPADHMVLHIEIAGIPYEGRKEHVLRCRVGETVRLQREPTNPHDANAIAVIDQRNHKLGYVPRARAERLAPLMDGGLRPAAAFITMVKGTPKNGAVGATIGLVLPTSIAASLGGGAVHAMTCEPRLDGGTYVFLDCDESTVWRARAALAQRYNVIRCDYPYRVAADGHHYQWYIALADAVDESEVRVFFERELGWTEPVSDGGHLITQLQSENEQLRALLAQKKQHFIALNERVQQLEACLEPLWAHLERGDRDEQRLKKRSDGSVLETELQETQRHLAAIKAENAELRAQNRDLKQQIAQTSAELCEMRNMFQPLKKRADDLERDLQSKKKALKSAMEGMEAWIRELCPNLTLMRDSADVLITELQDRGPALRLLRELAKDRRALRGERVERARQWRELRFSTGQDNTGRLYYSEGNDGSVRVLISFKSEQERDIKYLAKN